MFDIAFVGHFTRDTVVNVHGTSTNPGGAFYYGAHVATRMGLKAAVVTRLAREDWAVVEELQGMGVAVFPRTAPKSTTLRLVYPTANLDDRVIYADGFAGPFTVEEVAPIGAKTCHIGASIRGEVPIPVIQELAAKGARVSLDVQGFVRINQNGQLAYASWPEMAQVLRLVDVLKVDGTEAHFITGKTDMREASRALAAYGPQEIVLTQNEGVLVLAGGRFVEVPWRVREIKGRTGRGDTCIAAYLCKRLQTGPEEAARFSAAVTGLKLEAPGPFQGEIPKDW